MHRFAAVLSLALFLAMGAVQSKAQGGADYQGQPSLLREGAEASYWIWHDRDGYHLRTTTAHDRRTFSGRIAFTGEGWWVKSYQLGAEDEVRLTNEGVHFRLRTQKTLEGFDFRMQPGTQSTFYLELDDTGAGKLREHTFIGHENLHPQSIPFSLSHSEREVNRGAERF